MLRQCIQGARRHRSNGRQWSSLPSSSSLTWDSSNDNEAGQRRQHYPLLMAAAAPAPLTNHVAVVTPKRYFSISRHTDPLTQHGTINTLDADDIDDGKGLGENAMSQKMSEMGASGLWDEEESSNEYDIFGTSGFNDDDGEDNGDGEEQDELALADAAFKKRQAEINAELDKRTGRLWTDDWIITDEEWMSTETFDDIEEWKPTNATRKSLESVKVFEGGVPTLGEMAGIEFPAPLPPHPGHGNPSIYAKYRKGRIRNRIRTAIQMVVAQDLKQILAMESWDEKQEAVDGLFEVIEERVREREPIMGKLPGFSDLVEQGLEYVLRIVHQRMRVEPNKEIRAARHEAWVAAKQEALGTANSEEGADVEGEAEENSESKEESKPVEASADVFTDVMGVNKEIPVPVFMDILAASRKLKQQTPSDDSSDDADGNTLTKPALSPFFTESNKAGVPNLIYPLDVHHNEGIGRMVEEWELAANKETKRIMMRDCMREIASKVAGAANCCSGEVKEEEKGSARVFVKGKRGVGKTAALAGMVASARMSGHIVLYLPDGDRLRKHGFYNEPCSHRSGLYNLPEIAKEFCEQLLTSHGDDLKQMPSVKKEEMKEFLSDDQVRRVFRRAYKEDETVSEEEVAAMTEMSLEKLLTVAMGSSALSSGLYGTVISVLMNQTLKPFTVVMDEFNVYYDHGHYFHGNYHEQVSKAIPLNKITLFKPFLDAMGLYPTEAGTTMKDDMAVPSSEAMMKWGSIIVGTSEGRAVRRSFTESLTDAAHALAKDEHHPVHVVDIRRFSDMEAQHILYNFEITGIGRLRFDRGDTALNPEEVEYLRLVSGGSGQQLMDACMIP